MTKEQFAKQYGAELKAFIDSPCGQATLNMVGILRPPYEYPPHEHLLIEGRGALRGYEMCLRNIIALTVQFAPQPEVEADYGIPDSTKEK